MLFKKLFKNEIIYLAATSAEEQNDNTINSSSSCHKLIDFVIAASNHLHSLVAVWKEKELKNFKLTTGLMTKCQRFGVKISYTPFTECHLYDDYEQELEINDFFHHPKEGT